MGLNAAPYRPQVLQLLEEQEEHEPEPPDEFSPLELVQNKETVLCAEDLQLGHALGSVD